MKLLLIAAGIVVSALVAIVARRRLSGGDIDTVEPVSGDWLAHARSHEDTQW